MENQLVKTINESGLEKTKAQVLLDNFACYFDIAADWENKANMLVITSVEQRAEMKMAREGRLFLREKRIAVEKTRKILKESALREGQTIDAIAKILTNLILPIEESLEQKEKYAEIQEANRRAQLMAVREEELLPYMEFVPYGLNLGEMQDGEYVKLLDGAKLQHKNKIEELERLERERVEAERKEAEERERIRIENEKLKAEAIERERQLLIERENAEIEKRKLEIIAQREREEAAKVLEAERQKVQKEAIERERLERELKQRQEEESKRIINQQNAEIKAKNAPSKEKLLIFANQIADLVRPEVTGEEAILILSNTNDLLAKVVLYIKTKTELI